MNRLSTPPIPAARARGIARLAAGLLAVAHLAACNVPASESAPSSGSVDGTTYDSVYRLTVDPGDRSVTVSLRVSQSRHLLREMRFGAEPARLVDVTGDGSVDVDGGEVTWMPPEGGGELRWTIRVGHERAAGAYDAWLGDDWGVFRAEDVIPRAATRTLRGARSKTELEFELPRGWSAITEYSGRNGRFAVERAGRRFDQPAGWISVGDLGVRRDRIAGVAVAVAAPVGLDVRRMDMLALANWVLPEMARILPSMPPRITIVSAGEPMWRGGLSAPQSLFLHADRPMLSENGTSTLVHELLHVATGLSANDGYDWIVEGLAEYYTLQLLVRSGTITARRHERALEDLEAWADEATVLCAASSSGATTAYAVTLFAQLDREIRATSTGERSLDDVLYRLVAADRPVDLGALAGIVSDLVGEVPELIDRSRLPGCRTLALVRDEPQ